MRSKVEAVRASRAVLEYHRVWVRGGGYRSTGQVWPTVLVSRETFNVSKRLGEAAERLYRCTEGMDFGDRAGKAKEARVRLSGNLAGMGEFGVRWEHVRRQAWIELDEGQYQTIVKLGEAASDLALEVLFADEGEVRGDDKVSV